MTAIAAAILFHALVMTTKDDKEDEKRTQAMLMISFFLTMFLIVLEFFK